MLYITYNMYTYMHVCTCISTSQMQSYKHTYMQCNFLWNQRWGIHKSACLLPVTQQCSMELKLWRLPSLDEDVFSCDSISECSLSSSNKGSPPPPKPTKHSVNIWTGLAFLSRMCQRTGGKGLQVSSTKCPLFWSPSKLWKLQFIWKGERNKERSKMQ